MSDRESLIMLLSPVVKNSENVSDKLLERYGNTTRLAEATIDEMSGIVGSQNIAIYIKTVSALAGRAITDGFKLGKKHTDEEIRRYVLSKFTDKSVETVLSLSLDGAGRVISADFLGEGIVNYSTIMPRKLLDISMKRGAAGVILAHNHPGGEAKPSEADIATTAHLASVLNCSGIKIIGHYIVAGKEIDFLEGQQL